MVYGIIVYRESLCEVVGPIGPWYPILSDQVNIKQSFKDKIKRRSQTRHGLTVQTSTYVIYGMKYFRVTAEVNLSWP